MRIYSKENNFLCENCYADYDDFALTTKKLPENKITLCYHCADLLSESLNKTGIEDLKYRFFELPGKSLDKVLAFGIKAKICNGCVRLTTSTTKKCTYCGKNICKRCFMVCTHCKKYICIRHSFRCECYFNGCHDCTTTHKSGCKVLLNDQKNRDKGKFTKNAFRFKSDIESGDKNG